MPHRIKHAIEIIQHTGIRKTRNDSMAHGAKNISKSVKARSSCSKTRQTTKRTGYKDDKSAGELEYVAQPVAFGILTLLCIAAMIAVPVVLMPSIMAGDTEDLTTLITTELVCGIFGFIFFYFNVKSYITEFINHIRSKSRKTEQKQSSKDDGDL